MAAASPLKLGLWAAIPGDAGKFYKEAAGAVALDHTATMG
jgi:hypothetical protein